MLPLLNHNAKTIEQYKGGDQNEHKKKRPYFGYQKVSLTTLYTLIIWVGNCREIEGQSFF